MFNNKIILVTGATGSFGKKFCDKLSKEDADKWTTNKSVRTATPEEVKRAYGK